MSAFIRPRTYTARDAAIYQQRPAAIIDAVEDVQTAVYSVHLIVEHSAPHLIKAVRPVVVATHGLTGATRFALRGKSWSTTDTAVIDSAPADAQGASWEQWAEQAREALERAATQQQHRATNTAANLRVERLAAIQSALGFTTQDLAAVLGLSRPQLYRWLDAADDVRMQDAKRQRLAAVERVTKAWQERSPAPLRSVAHEPLADGTTLFARLSTATIDEPALHAAFDELMAKLQAQPKTLSQRLADAGFKRRPSVRSLPSDE